MTGTTSGLPFGFDEPPEPQRTIFDALHHVDVSAAHSFEVGVPMRDGTELAATIHLPPAGSRPAPAIVHGTPYDKDGFVPPDDVAGMVAAGYACVRYDSRGRGKSEGVWHPFTDEGRDGHDVVEWVAEQEWCTGAVGVEGLSYDGWIVIATMSQKPPHLKAAIPFSAAGRWQQEIPYTYGCFQLFFAWWWAMVRRRIMDGSRDVPKVLDMLPVESMGVALDVAGPGWQEWMEHDTLDELWRGRRFDGAYDFDVPTLHVTGWHDREDIQAAFHHYEQMIDHSPARARQWLLVGPWSHVSTYYPTDVYKGVKAPGGNLDMAAIRLKFFDRFLRDDDNGVDDEPRVRIYDPGLRGWQTRPAWRGDTVEHELFLSGGSGLAAAPGVDGATAYRYDPLEPSGMAFDVNALPWEPPLDLVELEADPAVVSWTGVPLDQDLTVRGWGEVDLHAATDGEDTEWHVKLADVDENGRALCVAWGCLRASYGRDAANPAPVVAGDVNLYTIELTPAFHTFRAGHRFRLVLASSEFPWFARNLNTFGPIGKQAEPRVATNTIHHGTSRPSSIRLKVEH